MSSLDQTHLVSLLEAGAVGNKVALWVGLLGAALALYGVGLAVYRLWLHPLAKFPGPPLMALTDLNYMYRQHVMGNFVREARELHAKHGKIVRIGPDRLSIDGSIGWPEIYGHRPGGDATEFHKIPGWFFPNDTQSIINAPTREDHRRQRRQLSHAFSEAAMVEQAPIIMQYIDLFIQRLRENSAGGQPIDIVRWLNFVTFDIIGDLSLGESFHSLENSNYHPWVLNIFRGVRGINKMRFFARLSPTLGRLYPRIEKDGTIKANMENMRYAREKALARTALGVEPPNKGIVGPDGKTTVRRDFITYMMRSGSQGSDGKSVISQEELLNNAFLLITGGSETTGTNLASLFSQLALPSKRVYRDAVNAEVRAAFTTGSEMTLVNVSPKALPLLHACIEESLRFHPPVATMGARVSPGATVGGHWIPKGVMFHVGVWTTQTNPEHFYDPDTWRPERFLPASHPMYDARFANDNMSVFKPFSNGPRDCIGKNLAYAEMRLIVARVLLEFDVELAPEAPEDWLTTQRSFGIWEKQPLMIKFNKRKDAVAN